MKIRGCLTAFAFTTISLSSFGGQPENRNFETGDISGWGTGGWAPSCCDIAAMVGPGLGFARLQGDYSLLLLSRGGVAPPCPSWDPWSLACPFPAPIVPVSGTPLEGFGSVYPYDSATSQHVSLRAGDTLSFDFQLFGVDYYDWLYVTLFKPKSDGPGAILVCGNIGIGDQWYSDRFCYTNPPYRDIEFYLPPAPCYYDAATVPGYGDRLFPVGKMQVTAPYDGDWILQVGVAGFDHIGSVGAIVDNFKISKQPPKECQNEETASD